MTETIEQEEVTEAQPQTTPEQQLVIVEGMLDRIFGGKKDEVDVMDLSTKLKLGHRPLANLLHVVSTLTEDMREIRSRCKKLEEGLKVPDDV